jgi:hypothetical protein
MDSHFCNALPDGTGSEMQSNDPAVSLEIPDSPDEEVPPAHNTVNHAQTSEVEVGERHGSLPSSSDVTAPGLVLNETFSAEHLDKERASCQISEKGLLTLSLGAQRYSCELDLRRLDESRNDLNAIAPNGSFTTKEFLYKAMEVIMPDILSSINLQVAVRLATFTLQLAAPMLPNRSPSVE